MIGVDPGQFTLGHKTPAILRFCELRYQWKQCLLRKGGKNVKMGCHIFSDCHYRRTVRVHGDRGSSRRRRPIPLLPVHRHIRGGISFGALRGEEVVLAVPHEMTATERRRLGIFDMEQANSWNSRIGLNRVSVVLENEAAREDSVMRESSPVGYLQGLRFPLLHRGSMFPGRGELWLISPSYLAPRESFRAPADPPFRAVD